jgi:hypothetical protein
VIQSEKIAFADPKRIMRFYTTDPSDSAVENEKDKEKNIIPK